MGLSLFVEILVQLAQHLHQCLELPHQPFDQRELAVTILPLG